MKRLSLLCVALCCLILFTSNRIGRGFAFGQPVTTAPGEPGQYCGSFGCHFSGAFDPEVQLNLITTDGLAVNEYTPRNNYTVELIINHTGLPAGYGFQMVSLKDEDTTAINNFFNLPQGVRKVNIANRQYVEHSTILPNDTITLEWIAPESGTGSVSFYAAGNAVNGNGNSSGDGADTTQMTILEKQTSSLSDFNPDYNINVYPNPAEDYIIIESNTDFETIRVWDQNGKLLLRSSSSNISLEGIASGIYYISVEHQKGTVVRKLIKI